MRSLLLGVGGEELLEEGCVEVGQAALAQYGSEEWHRVTYLGRGVGAMYQVYYVDFGNVGEVAELMRIPQELSSVPAQAMHCMMKELEGGSPGDLQLQVVIEVRKTRGAPYFMEAEAAQRWIG